MANLDINENELEQIINKQIDSISKELREISLDVSFSPANFFSSLILFSFMRIGKLVSRNSTLMTSSLTISKRRASRSPVMLSVLKPPLQLNTVTVKVVESVSVLNMMHSQGKKTHCNTTEFF